MAKPLRLFIRPPYNTWSLVHSYGWRQNRNDLTHTHILLRTNGGGELFAAATGRLSIFPPDMLWGGPEIITLLPPGAPIPDSVNLYLHMTPFRALDVLFMTRAAGVIPGISTDFTGLRILGFAYRLVETASLEVALAEGLDYATFPRSSFTRRQVVEGLLRGELTVPILAGHALGRAAQVAPPGAMRSVGFNFLSNKGPVDPSHMYDWMRDFVADNLPDLDDFLALAPKMWPLINTSYINIVMGFTKNALYAMPVLEEMRVRVKLSDVQWREVGNNQKDLWRARLLKRSGHAPPGSQQPPFEFNDADWNNIFQLEAVAEFFMNYTDPWRTGGGAPVPGVNEPRSPFLADGVTPNPAYRRVDFLNPSGTSATIDPGSLQTLRLDGAADLQRVRANKDTILLNGDTARPSHLFTILSVDPAARTVTVDGFPNLAGGSSAWIINLRPILVLIDSFGRRRFTDGAGALHNLTGSAATLAGAAPNVLALDGNPNLGRVNPNFDTIYLSSDAARGSRTYRITAVDNANRRVTLDGNPNLSGGASSWYIPAGVGGDIRALNYNLGPGGAQGWDHYDGMLFVVHNNEIRSVYRWTSYTSRNYAPDTNQNLSSIRGNQQYDWKSYRSPADPVHPGGPPFRNYCFSVVDHGAAYDGVREARFYFRTPVGDDTAPGVPGVLGKTGIRLHYGNQNKPVGGSGSAGCLVSPEFFDLRAMLIDIYQVEYRAMHSGNIDAEVQKARIFNLADSQTLWHNTENGVGPPNNRLTFANWYGKLSGALWLIRPDERPLP